MKKVLAAWIMLMSLGTLVSFAQMAPVIVERTIQTSKLSFSEIYVNELPDAVVNRLTLEGAMVKRAFVAYNIDGIRIYKVCVITKNSLEDTWLLTEKGSLLK